MWHFFKDVFGNWNAYYFSGPIEYYAAGGIGDVMLAATIVVILGLLAWFTHLMGALLFLPFACVMLAVGIFGLLTSIAGDDGAVGAALVVVPVIMYAWACVCFGLRGATAGFGDTVPRGVGLILFGLVVIVVCGGMADLIGPVVAVPLVAQFFIWWATIAVDYSGPLPMQVLRIVFRVLGILAVVGLVLWIAALVRGGNEAGGEFSIVGLLAALGLGLAPLVVGGLLSHLGSAVCLPATLAAYAALVIVPAKAGRRLPVMGLCLGYLALIACYLLHRADLSSLPPIDVPDAIAFAVADNPLVNLGGSLMAAIASSFAEVGTAVLQPIMGLVGSVFETSAPSFVLPELAGCIVGFACAVAALMVADGVAARMVEKG